MNFNLKKFFLLAIIIGLVANKPLAATEISTYAPSSLIAGYALANINSKDTYKLCAVSLLAWATLMAERIDGIYELNRDHRSEQNGDSILVLMAVGFTFGVVKNGITSVIKSLEPVV